MSNLYRVGFMGAGKSAVGRALAERLGRPFLGLGELVAGAACAT
jgi:shikimate kinase